MADVVYLHVGAPKTGTTFLQDRLHANRFALADRGYHYPVGEQPDMFAPALDLVDRWWGGLLEEARGEWENLATRVRRTPGTVIVSHEILAGARRDQVARALADLDAEVHIVYSARDLARQIPAEWQESVKHQARHSFQKFLRRVRRSERRDSALWFWRVQELPDVLERWAESLPPQHVHLVTVPRPGAGPDELWGRYARAFGFDPAWAPETTARENRSIGIDETALVRELNRRLINAGLDSATYRALIRHLVVHETLAHREGMRQVTVPPRLQPWAEGVTQEWIDWIAAAGIDVIGDVEDLRPVFPEGEWEDPDRPDPGNVAGAAVDALVAVVMDSAGRDQELPPVRHRLGRAARRFRGL